MNKQMIIINLIFLLLLSFASASDLSDKMTSYYALQNTSIIDSVGSNDGTVISAVTATSSNVIIPDGMNFAGVNDYIDFSNELVDEAGTFSIDGWFYISDVGSINAIYNQGDANNNNGFYLHTYSSHFCYSYHGIKLGCGSETINDSTLYYFAFVRNVTDTSNQNRLYINSVSQTLDSSEKTADPSTGSFTYNHLGIKGYGDGDFLGNMDEIAFYDGYSLSQDDIDARYNSGAGCYYTDCGTSSLTLVNVSVFDSLNVLNYTASNVTFNLTSCVYNAGSDNFSSVTVNRGSCFSNGSINLVQNTFVCVSDTCTIDRDSDKFVSVPVVYLNYTDDTYNVASYSLLGNRYSFVGGLTSGSGLISCISTIGDGCGVSVSNGCASVIK